MKLCVVMPGYLCMFCSIFLIWIDVRFDLRKRRDLKCVFAFYVAGFSRDEIWRLT